MVSKKTIRYEKKSWGQNCSSQEDINIYFRSCFDQTRSFYFNRKKHQKKKITFCTKYMQDTEKMLRNLFVYLENIYNFGVGHFL